MSEYIEREAVLREPLFLLPQRKEKGMPFPVISVHSVQNLIKTIPAADVRPVVRGEWIASKAMVGIDVNFNPIIGDTYRCSICHEDLTKKYRFCPNCGADMRGERND